MNCQDVRRHLSAWLDGELEDASKRDLEAHISGCVSCREESKALRTLNLTLREDAPSLEPSRGFEAVFWTKVSERRRLPWFKRFLADLEALIPVPNRREALAFLLLAFFIGNAGGFASRWQGGILAGGSAASLRHFSSLQEFQGVPSYSLAAVYLRSTETGSNS